MRDPSAQAPASFGKGSIAFLKLAFWKWEVGVMLLVIVVAPLLHALGIKFYAQSMLIAPSGVVPGVGFVALVGVSVWSIYRVFTSISRVVRWRKGDRLEPRPKVHLGDHLVYFVCMQLAIAPAVVLILNLEGAERGDWHQLSDRAFEVMWKMVTK